ncbi:hypothetical protein NT6N_03320 [Oceaniferula spumae]|uniref:Right handed beta helix domain-containing protein n=1 Tax=Oceaniferula spumae TaxID=2979115 RepID=A0AAT9FH43_9BACT
MKNTEARKILGLDPSDDPRSYLSAFDETKAYKRELVENAPSPELKFRYQQELLEYEAAVKVVAGHKRIRPNTDFIVVLMLIGALSACGWWGYNWYQRQWNIDAQQKQRSAFLASVGRTAVSKRKWDQAEEAYKDMLRIDPNSKIAAEGIESIRRGKLEERSQQLYYSLGESQAALEAGRWDEAEQLANSVLEIDPENSAAKRKLEIISEGKHKQAVSLKMMAVTDALDAGKISDARKALVDLREIDPKNANLLGLAKRIDEANAEIRAQKTKAAALLAAAQKLDTGEFSARAMALLAEARKLDPTNTEIAELHSKMSAYTRAITVPGDYPTISEALEAARPRDLIRISAGTYKESLIIDQPVRLQGTGDGKTIIELPSTEASLITINPEAKGTFISGINLNHKGFDHSTDRFSGITILAQEVTIAACNVHHSAGHGIAVLDGGKATITGCEISACGWDGISVYGAGSHAVIRDTHSHGNIQHGLGFWKGGSGSVSKCRMVENGLCGVLAMGAGAKVSVISTVCSDNREAGILISDGVIATLTANRCEENLLSGIVLRSATTTADVTKNVTNNNHEAGILSHRGVKIGKFEENKAQGNTSHQIWRDANLTQSSEVE